MSSLQNFRKLKLSEFYQIYSIYIYNVTVGSIFGYFMTWPSWTQHTQDAGPASWIISMCQLHPYRHWWHEWPKNNPPFRVCWMTSIVIFQLNWGAADNLLIPVTTWSSDRRLPLSYQARINLHIWQTLAAITIHKSQHDSANNKERITFPFLTVLRGRIYYFWSNLPRGCMFFITLFLIRQIFRDFSFVEANCKAIFKLTDDLPPPPPQERGVMLFGWHQRW